MERDEIIRVIVEMAKVENSRYYETCLTGVGMRADALMGLLERIGDEAAIEEVRAHRAALCVPAKATG